MNRLTGVNLLSITLKIERSFNSQNYIRNIQVGMRDSIYSPCSKTFDQRNSFIKWKIMRQLLSLSIYINNTCRNNLLQQIICPIHYEHFLTDVRAKTSPTVTCIRNTFQLDVIINIVCDWKLVSQTIIIFYVILGKQIILNAFFLSLEVNYYGASIVIRNIRTYLTFFCIKISLGNEKLCKWAYVNALRALGLTVFHWA